MALRHGGYVLAGLWGPGVAAQRPRLQPDRRAQRRRPDRRREHQRAAPPPALVPARDRPGDVRHQRRARLQLRAPLRQRRCRSPRSPTPFHLAFYPFLVGGLLLLIHERDEDRDRSALIDALTVTLALATLLWVYLISPYANDHTMSAFERLASIGYPAMDILVVGVLARLAAGSHRREPAFMLHAVRDRRAAR